MQRKINFVKKAVIAAPSGTKIANKVPEAGRSNIGSERARHKYIKREQIAPGKYKYIYDQTDSSKSPSPKDMEQMVEDFKAALSQDPYFSKFSKYFGPNEYTGIVSAMQQRGEDATPEAVVQELGKIRNALGVEGSQYLPTSVAAQSYIDMLSTASSNPTKYNEQIVSAANKAATEASVTQESDINYMQASGISEQQIEQYKNDPEKLKELADRLSRTYQNLKASQ